MILHGCIISHNFCALKKEVLRIIIFITAFIGEIHVFVVYLVMLIAQTRISLAIGAVYFLEEIQDSNPIACRRFSVPSHLLRLIDCVVCNGHSLKCWHSLNQSNKYVFKYDQILMFIRLTSHLITTARPANNTSTKHQKWVVIWKTPTFAIDWLSGAANRKPFVMV